MLYLNVPFNEKDSAKALGAKWDSEKRKWYVQSQADYGKFTRWIPNYSTIIRNHLYLVVGIRKCFNANCNHNTTVVGVGFDDYFQCVDGSIVSNKNSSMNIVPLTDDFPQEIIAFAVENYDVYVDKTAGSNSYYLANHCDYCGIVHGNNFLFQEVDSPFFINSKKDLDDLKLISFNLDCDLCIENDMDSICSYDEFDDNSFDPFFDFEEEGSGSQPVNDDNSFSNSHRYNSADEITELYRYEDKASKLQDNLQDISNIKSRIGTLFSLSITNRKLLTKSWLYEAARFTVSLLIIYASFEAFKIFWDKIYSFQFVKSLITNEEYLSGDYKTLASNPLLACVFIATVLVMMLIVGCVIFPRITYTFFANSYNRKYHPELVTLISKKNKINAQNESIYNDLANSPLPKTYWNNYGAICELLHNHRADNLTSAINLFEEIQYRNKVNDEAFELYHKQNQTAEDINDNIKAIRRNTRFI